MDIFSLDNNTNSLVKNPRVVVYDSNTLGDYSFGNTTLGDSTAANPVNPTL